MYAYPAYPVYRPPRTPEGLKWTQVSFVIYFAVLAVQLVVAILVASLFAGIGTGTDPTTFLNSILALVALGIVTFILMIVVLIFYFIGFGYMYGGRSEFGPDHSRNLGIALYTVIAAVIVAPIGAVVSFVVGLSTLFSFPFDPAAIANAVMLTLILGMAFNLVVAVLVAATLVLAVRAIAAPSHNMLLLAGAGIGCITPAVVGGLTIWQTSRILDLLSGAGFVSFDFGMGIPAALGSALGLITMALFLIAYRGAANRLRTGELKPTPQPMPVVPMVPVYPYPMVPPPAPLPPPTPPPATPPGPTPPP